MNAELISIGDEILIGQITNTNTVWIARQLNLKGIRVRYMCTVADERAAILEALELSLRRADLVIITGGLGPTRDDITKDVLAEFFNVPLVLNDQALRDVEAYFALRGHELNDLNRRQALVPEGCTIIRNPRGTAPGLWLKKNNTQFFSLPGVPYEMKPMVNDFIIPSIVKVTSLPAICHRTILTIGVGESELAEKIAMWENDLRDKQLQLAYLPQPGQVRLRISGYGSSATELSSLIEKKTGELRELIGKYIYGEENYGEESRGIVTVLFELLRSRKNTLSLAESCTGGYLSSLITAHPGASEIFRGSVVPYNNSAKHQLLHVDPHIFEQKGAVSEECVRELAANVLQKFGSDYSISISGIAGPTGGSVEKPVGTVWIAVANSAQILTRKFRFGDNREYNIITSANAAADMLRRFILNIPQNE